MHGHSPMDLQASLICPKDHHSLTRSGDRLVCPGGHRYDIVEGVPVLLRDDVTQTLPVASASLAAAEHPEEAPLYLSSVGVSDREREIARRLASGSGRRIDPVATVLTAATGGYAYKHLVTGMPDYPIPEIRLPQGSGPLLDVGCSWGRWTIAAARKGYRVTGIDPSLGAVLAGKRVARQLGVDASFICADARFLPFADASFNLVYSYSVFQHFAAEDASRAIGEISRVLKDEGVSLVQMAHRLGLRSLYHQLRRRFRATSGFDVRYWDLRSLREAFTSAVGPTELSAHCFFGLGLEASDVRFMPGRTRALIAVSEGLVGLSRAFPPLACAADSVYVMSKKEAAVAGPTTGTE